MEYLSLPFKFIERVASRHSDTFNEKRLKKGKSYAKNCHCIIASLLRDAEDSFPYGVKLVNKFSKIFKSVDVFILENGSKDKTRELWEKFCDLTDKKQEEKEEKGENIKIFVTSPDVEDKLLSKKTKEHDASKERIKKMVKLRNILLQKIKDNSRKFDCDTYIFMTDLDIKGNLHKTGIYDTFYYFQKNKEISSIGCNSLAKNYFYFDSYAYKDYHKGETLVHPSIEIPINKGLYPVKSSFSGGVFYKYDVLINMKYKFKSKKGKIICEHITLNSSLPKMYINTNMIYDVYSH